MRYKSFSGGSIKSVEIVSVKIIATMDMEKQTTGTVHVVHLNSGDRLFLAARILAICWGAAAGAVLIPIAHFVLVPAGLIAGFVMARRAFGFTERLSAGSLLCPKCASALEVSLKPFEWPKHELCPQCGIDILLKKA